MFAGHRAAGGAASIPSWQPGGTAHRAPPTCACCFLQGWQRFTTGSFQLLEVDGHHLWPLDKVSKAVWLTTIAEHLGQLAA